ncbi:MAG: cache domain-containing protein [Arcobacter sp.]|uniref:sensor histidine kinase n=1 Tax=Arcobacter sp. TaxID=1872629 RepID=UPI0025911EBE|nr:cache domain-containing protein [Arcobacter sp.]MDD3009357.1 cache domain-containing protein [Arcobacter sp.]
METSKEKQFLKIIKFMPSIFVIFFSIFVILFLYFENKNTFNEEKKDIEEKYILENKENIKEEVSKVYSFIKQLQKSTEQELKNSVKNRVYEAHGIATGIYEKYKDTKTNEEIFELIKIALGSLSFNDGRGYIFMDDVYGNKLLHPIDTSIEGKNFIDYTDARGYKLFQSIVNVIKEKTERFDEYYWYKPNTNEQVARKISFYKYFEPLNMAIGTGEYFEDFEKMIQKKALEYINMIKFGNSGYIFVLNYDGLYLSHIKKDYIGKNYIENKGIENSEKVIPEMIEIAKKGNGFYSYIQNEKPTNNLPTKKISYIQGLNDWNWLIGTGFYEDDINSKILETKRKLDEKYDNYIKNILIIGSILIVILLLISRYVSLFLENKFRQYKKELDKKQLILHQQSKMAAMGEMIGNIAHQWRQPLSTITTASSGMVLQKEMGILTDEFFFEASKKINTSAQYLSQTIDDFRNFFSPIIKNIEDIELFSYENELIQALINILNNSRDELLKKENERYIFIDVYKNDIDEVNIIIKDNAGGIKEEVINKIFEPYFTTKHQSQGTGIGLYMTEEIVTKHLNGIISVKNKEFIFNDKKYIGAQFRIKLKLSEEE